VALGLTPGLVAAPKDKLASLIPIVPTTMRQFQQSDQVTAYLKVYQGGKEPLLPVVITSRIVDDRGDTVSNLVQRIGVDQFQAARSADYRLELPLAGLRAGAHVLQVDASVGHSSAQRDVRFMMR
jgi:hypothetical protein